MQSVKYFTICHWNVVIHQLSLLQPPHNWRIIYEIISWCDTSLMHWAYIDVIDSVQYRIYNIYGWTQVYYYLLLVLLILYLKNRIPSCIALGSIDVGSCSKLTGGGGLSGHVCMVQSTWVTVKFFPNHYDYGSTIAVSL